MSFANDLFSALSGYRDHLVQGGVSELVGVVEADLGHLAGHIGTNVLAAESAAHDIIGRLYTASAVVVPPPVFGAPVPIVDLSASQPVPAAEPVAAPVEPAPVLVADGGFAGASGLEIQHAEAAPVEQPAAAAYEVGAPAPAAPTA